MFPISTRNLLVIFVLTALWYESYSQSLDRFLNYSIQNEISPEPIQTRPVNEKFRLAITIILPQDFIRFRNFHVCINREVNKINKSNWEFLRHFILERSLIHFQLEIEKCINFF